MSQFLLKAIVDLLPSGTHIRLDTEIKQKVAAISLKNLVDIFGSLTRP